MVADYADQEGVSGQATSESLDLQPHFNFIFQLFSYDIVLQPSLTLRHYSRAHKILLITPDKITFTILLEPERQSCQRIYALRTKFGLTSPFAMNLIRYNICEIPSNFELLIKATRKVAEKQAPFDIGLRDPYRTHSKSRAAIKYHIVSTDLAKL